MRHIKRAVRPTAGQKKYLSGKLKLDAAQWLVISWDDKKAILKNKTDGEIREVKFPV